MAGLFYLRGNDLMKKFMFVVPALIMFAACNNSEPLKINTLEFRLAETEPADSLEKFTFELSGEVFYLHTKSEISEAHISASKMVAWNNSEAIEIKFNEEGTKLFAELTRNNIGKRIGMVLNGELVSAPIVQAEIQSGKALVPLVKKK
jgi:preprotein translocase subunit SecD